jgi:hypothetical protein
MMGFRSYPDFGVVPSGSMAPDIDMAELAARLGSPMTWRRDGRVLSLTDFCPSRNGWVFSDPVLTAIVASNYAYIGGASVRCKSTYVGVGVTIYRRMPLASNTRIGLEMMICEEVGISHELKFTIGRQISPTEIARGVIWVKTLNSTIYYVDSVGNLQLCYTRPMPFIKGINHNFKLVVDFTTLKYVRFFADDIEIKLDATMQTSLSSASDQMYFEITGWALPATIVNFYIDNAIITCAEY